MGLGDRLPFGVARHVVPRMPTSRQRFLPSDSWESASARSVGYRAITPPVRTTVEPAAGPLSGNEVAAIAAFGVALARIGTRDRPITVVDFGGYDGRYANLIRAAYPDVAFMWTVVELPAVVAAQGARSTTSLIFTDDLDAALQGQVDVAFASASINYVPEPMTLLDRLLAASTACIVMRLPLWPMPSDHVAVQRTQRSPHEISYPTWFFSESAFFRHLSGVADCLLDVVCPDDRAAFGGHYSRYRGLVLAARRNIGSSSP